MKHEEKKSEENKTENNTGKFIGVFLLGTAIGAALGILFAPAKGIATRKKIAEKGEDITDALTEKFNEFLEGIKKEFATAKKKSLEYAENGKE
jgi:gas vesicle protein